MLKTTISKSNETRTTKFGDLPNDTIKHLTSYLSVYQACLFSRTSKELNELLLEYPKEKARVLKEFFQAVIDDHQDKVKAILDKDPWVLLEKPLKNQTLKSEFTHQIINLEGLTGLQVALLRNQLEMTKLILPYFNEIMDGSQEALKQWEACDVIKEAKKERIKAYGPKMKTLIEDIAGKTENEFDEIDFRTGLLPKDKAIRLDSYVDIEALLLSAYQVYDDYFDTFEGKQGDKIKDWKQRDKFCIKVIGFLQSLVSPETAKIFCEGIHFVEEEGRKPSDIAKSLKLASRPDVSFYRSSADSSKGLGFVFLVSSCGSPMSRWWGGRGQLSWEEGRGAFLENYVNQKRESFASLEASLKQAVYEPLKPASKRHISV